MNIFSCGFTITHFSAFYVSALIFLGKKKDEEVSLLWNLLLVIFKNDFSALVTLYIQKFAVKAVIIIIIIFENFPVIISAFNPNTSMYLGLRQDKATGNACVARGFHSLALWRMSQFMHLCQCVGSDQELSVISSYCMLWFTPWSKQSWSTWTGFLFGLKMAKLYVLQEHVDGISVS